MAGLGVVFSSGFFGFFAHAGFLRALRETGLEASGYGGTSSGAVVAAMAASGMPDDAIQEVLFSVRKADFWDPDPPGVLVREALGRFRGYTGYLGGEGFAKLLRKIPLKRIEDARVPLVIGATNLTERREHLFTRGDLISALQASGAVPVFFKPVEIDGCLYVDGGVVNKAPLLGLADAVRPEKVLVHFIPSADMAGDGNPFLKKAMTPLHLQHLAINIGRQEAYRLQREMALGKGIELREVVSDAPSVGPNTLGLGPRAYQRAYERGLEVLGGLN
ncbi:MAG: patatin-like phospholipase family protein [Thermodesulfobacteriota bacterium]